MKRSKTLLAGAFALALAACNGNDATHTDGGSGDLAEMPNAAGDIEDRSQGMAATMGEDATATSMMGDAGMSGATDLAEADRKALMAVMEVDRHEIAASEAAMAKNVEGPVRDYAETLRDDHTRNLEATRNLLGGRDTGTDSGSRMTTVAGGTAATTGDATGADPMAADGAMDAAGHPDLAAMKRKHDAERERLAELDGQAFETAWVDAMATGHQEALTKLDSELIPSATDSRVRDHLQTTRKAIAAHLETARNLQQRR